VPIGALWSDRPTGRRISRGPILALRDEIPTFSTIGPPGAHGPELALPSPRKADTVAQRTIEMLIGRLITDEQFRREFLSDPEQTLLGLRDRGFELSRTEIAALVSTDPSLWMRAAEVIDPRLQKACLTPESRIP
jgi:hypothetical protein